MNEDVQGTSAIKKTPGPGSRVERVVDDIFEHPRVVAIYDARDPDRSDLDVYAGIVGELRANRVLDSAADRDVRLMLTGRGLEVTGVDPAGGSLDVARAKPGAGLDGNPARGARRAPPRRSPRPRDARPGVPRLGGVEPRGVVPRHRHRGSRQGRELGRPDRRHRTAGQLPLVLGVRLRREHTDVGLDPAPDRTGRELVFLARRPG